MLRRKYAKQKTQIRNKKKNKGRTNVLLDYKTLFPFFELKGFYTTGFANYEY